MAVSSIISQPALFDLRSAYRPLVIVAQSSAPVVYCDVYFDGIFYRTLSSSALGPAPLNTWRAFDIAPIAQEYVRTSWPTLQVVGQVDAVRSLASCFVKFRDSAVSGSTGQITPETPIPVQATTTNSAIPGGGLQSATFLVLNATLQWEESGDLRQYLQSLRSFVPANTAKGPPLVYQLSRRSGRTIYRDSFDFIGVLFDAYAFGTITGSFPSFIPQTLAQTAQIEIVGSNGQTYLLGALQSYQVRKTYFIPSGPGNLATLTGGNAVPWSTLDWYTVGLRVGGAPNAAAFQNVTLFRTARIYLKNRCDDGALIYFLNGLGAYDSAIFDEVLEGYVTKSTRTRRPANFLGTQANQTTATRSFVSGEVTLAATSQKYDEGAQPWLRELFETTDAFLEATVDGQRYGRAIVILDGDFAIRKGEERYAYTTTVSFTPSLKRLTRR